MNHTREKYLIYRCKGGIGAVHCSGWGNRVVGIVASYILANVTGRVFGIIMNNPCNLTNYLVPNKYNWSIPPERLVGLSSTFMDVRNSRKFTNSLQTINFNDRYKQDIIYIANNHDYHDVLLRNKLYKDRLKWLRGLNKAKIFKKILPMLFKPHQNIQSRLDAFLGKAKKDKKKILMCAQIRMGKNPTIPWDNRPLNSMNGVQNIWRFFHQHNSTNWIFVTTDSQQVRKQAMSEFKNNSLDTEGEIIHMDKAYRGNICRGMGKLILDQWILINCDILVISSSTFGRIPAYIRGTPVGLYLFSRSNVGPWNPFWLLLLLSHGKNSFEFLSNDYFRK